MPSGVYERSPEYRAAIGDVWRGRHQDPAVIAKRAASHAARPTASCVTCHRVMKIGKHFDKHREACWEPPKCAFESCDASKQYRYRYCVRHTAVYERCRKYGITMDDYMRIWIECGGACQGCKKSLAMHGSGADKRSVGHIDHDVMTGI